MKKLMLMVGAVLISGSLYAACFGPFCYDDQGAYIGGAIQDGNGSGIPVLSSTSINAIKPRATGQEVMCNTCVNNPADAVNKMAVCISTGTAAIGSYVMQSSASVVCK